MKNLKRIERKLIVQQVTGKSNFLNVIRGNGNKESVFDFLKIVHNYCRMNEIILEESKKMKTETFTVPNRVEALYLTLYLHNKLRHIKFKIDSVDNLHIKFSIQSKEFTTQDLVDIGVAAMEYIQIRKNKEVQTSEIPLVISAIERQIRIEEARETKRDLQIANQDKVLFNEPLQNVIPDYLVQLKIALSYFNQQTDK